MQAIMIAYGQVLHTEIAHKPENGDDYGLYEAVKMCHKIELRDEQTHACKQIRRNLWKENNGQKQERFYERRKEQHRDYGVAMNSFFPGDVIKPQKDSRKSTKI